MEINATRLKNLDDKNKISELRNILDTNGIRISHQRLLILNYFIDHDNAHPSAEEIYQDLKAVDPIISQATVYNTLNLFKNTKIIRELDFNMASKRFEFTKHVHGHFICESCSLIEDFDVNSISLPDSLDAYTISTQEIIYKGLCPKCKS